MASHAAKVQTSSAKDSKRATTDEESRKKKKAPPRESQDRTSRSKRETGGEFHEQFLPNNILHDLQQISKDLERLPKNTTTDIQSGLSMLARHRTQRSMHLDSLLLLMACSNNGQHLGFGDELGKRFRLELTEMRNYITYHGLKANDLLHYLGKFSEHAKECFDKKQRHPHTQLFKFIISSHCEHALAPQLKTLLETYGMEANKESYSATTEKKHKMA